MPTETSSPDGHSKHELHSGAPGQHSEAHNEALKHGHKNHRIPYQKANNKHNPSEGTLINRTVIVIH